jgi:hypothetical protein
MIVNVARLRLNPLWDDPADRVEELGRIDRFGQHNVSADPDAADIVLFPQCHMLPADWRLRTIREHPLNKHFADKVVVFDERDRTWCAFSGVYVSMPARDFDTRYQRPWGYFPVAQRDSSAETPDLLFSFIGSPSSRCRKPLFELRHPEAVIEKVRGFTFYDPTSLDFENRRARFRVILDRSRFVLCPRGRGTSSIRLYETMAAGRVPVIIADDWVAPLGPTWDEFSIRWPEGRVKGLVETIEERNGDWSEMSAAAVAAHREFFSPEVWFHRVIELIREIRADGTQASFPRAGIRNRAFLAVGADFARWRTSSVIRRAGKGVAHRFGLVQ